VVRISSSASQQAARYRLSLYLGIILIGANLRTPITSLGAVLSQIQQAAGLNGLGAGILDAIPLLVFALLSSLRLPPCRMTQKVKTAPSW
jgi:CP family cyanate transporter-like MFS transporter